MNTYIWVPPIDPTVRGQRTHGEEHHARLFNRFCCTCPNQDATL